jgi:hypothetical protein
MLVPAKDRSATATDHSSPLRMDPLRCSLVFSLVLAMNSGTPTC